MTTRYPSLEAAFRDRPVRIADWGYFECRETDLAAPGVEFFDDVEDPGHCRRAAFAGSGGHLVVLTVYGDPNVNQVVFACDAKIAGKSDFAERAAGAIPSMGRHVRGRLFRPSGLSDRPQRAANTLFNRPATKMVAGFAPRFIGIITTFCGIVRER
ncbi:hypothetical protein [Burkholderia cepacia]|uniref:hypothetical protein n=1 Tax=Burkholderia cepacia TaxID=292 RepID=UPI00158D4439|nr:hypothetical protein [Burkholderia cepacia]